jgi:hypothetical protein
MSQTSRTRSLILEDTSLQEDNTQSLTKDVARRMYKNDLQLRRYLAACRLRAAISTFIRIRNARGHQPIHLQISSPSDGRSLPPRHWRFCVDAAGHELCAPLSPYNIMMAVQMFIQTKYKIFAPAAWNPSPNLVHPLEKNHFPADQTRIEPRFPSDFNYDALLRIFTHVYLDLSLYLFF